MENIEEKTNDAPKPVRQTPAWLRGFLRWGLVILIAFALGAALIASVFHLPLQQDYKRVSSELESASAEITDLTGQLSELTAANESLQQNLDGATLQQSIFNALAEVRAARLAIAANDPAGARLAVTQAIQSLDTLAGLIDKEHNDIVGNMLEKANQANIDLQTDMAVALPALEQLDTNLVSLIQTLFP